MTSQTILVIEDNPTARRMFRVALESEGYVVVEAGTGAAALSASGQQTIDLVLQDWMLPDIGGLELARALRALPGGRERPIIALSGFHSMVEEAKGNPDAFDAVLLKPVELQALFKKVAAYLPANRMEHGTNAGKGRHILLVDDDGVQRKLATLHLGWAGFRVTAASDAVSALGAARAEKPDLILSDVLMPGSDGLDLCRAVRAEHELADLPIVLMSSHFDAGRDDAFARECGADAILARNHDLQPVIQAVLDALDRPRVPQRRSAPHVPHEYTERLMQQLKREVKVASELLERSAMQAAQLSILGGIADALARSTDTERVLGDALASCLDAGGMSKGALFKTGRDGRLVPVHAVGFSESERAELPTLFGHVQHLHDLSAGRTVSGAATADALRARAGLRVLAMIPCLGDGHTVGALLLGSNDSHVTDLDLLSFGRAMATYVSQALLLADSFAALRESADASRRLFSSLDVTETLGTLVQIATSRLADFCLIALLENSGSAHSRTLLHVDPMMTERLRAACPSHVAGALPKFMQDVVDTRCSERVIDFDAEAVPALDEPYASMMKTMDARCRLIVPLLVHEGALGVMLLCSSRRTGHEAADLALAEDLASRAALAIENARLYQAMSVANTLKDEFLATVSHELRTPLNAMLGWTHILKQSKLSEDQRAHAIDIIERNALTQTRLIEDLLDVSQTVAGKLDVDMNVIDLREVVAAAIDAILPALEAKGLHIVPPAPGVPVRVLGDARRLQQVAWNLLTNAIKFTPSGGHVRVELGTATGSARLRVTDDGSGVEPAFLPFVFERFKQADGKISRKYGGLGIGLAICRDIVGLHGGTLSAHSEGPGRGASFEVTLPCDLEQRTPQKPPAADPAGAARDPTHAWPELRSLKVLIVDDEQDARELLFEVMEDLGACPSLAESAATALDAIRREQPDVLLADIGMPGEDGYALIRKVRAMTESAGGMIPAAALTGHVRPEDRSTALTAGFQMHVAKPINMDRLLDVVANLARMAKVLKTQRDARD